jgi:hypothetical protein
MTKDNSSIDDMQYFLDKYKKSLKYGLGLPEIRRLKVLVEAELAHQENKFKKEKELKDA